MLLSNSTLLILSVIGVIFCFIGLGFRDKNPGIVLMGIGFLAVLYAVVQKAIETFS